VARIAIKSHGKDDFKTHPLDIEIVLKYIYKQEKKSA
jgi:hypothetical protein